MNESIFVKSCLSYLREMGLIDCYGVGGNGGHFAPAYFHYAKIPMFPDNIKNKVISLYYSRSQEYNPSECDINNFRAFDDAYNQTAGIYELDKSMRYLREKLKQAIEDIACDREVKCEF